MIDYSFNTTVALLWKWDVMSYWAVESSLLKYRECWKRVEFHLRANVDLFKAGDSLKWPFFFLFAWQILMWQETQCDVIMWQRTYTSHFTCLWCWPAVLSSDQSEWESRCWSNAVEGCRPEEMRLAVKSERRVQPHQTVPSQNLSTWHKHRNHAQYITQRREDRWRRHSPLLWHS